MKRTVRSLKALGDASRVQMLWILEDRELCSCEIQEVVGLGQSTVSRHLHVLEDAGFLLSAKQGLWKNYRLNPAPSPLVQGLLSVLRLAATTCPEATQARQRAATVRREAVCSARRLG